MSTVRRRDAAATREKILDAAEELFAERGYHGVSIREIVALAGVDLALVHYYFGPKDALFREVIERRGAGHAADHMAALEKLRAESDGPPGVAALIRAFCEPMFEKMSRGPQWRNYMHLLAHRALARQSEVFLAPYEKTFEPMTRAFIAAFREALPGSDEKNLFHAVYFMHGAIVYALAETGAIERLSDGKMDSSDFDTLLGRFVPFFTAGFMALAKPT